MADYKIKDSDPKYREGLKEGLVICAEDMKHMADIFAEAISLAGSELLKSLVSPQEKSYRDLSRHIREEASNIVLGKNELDMVHTNDRYKDKKAAAMALIAGAERSITLLKDLENLSGKTKELLKKLGIEVDKDE